MRRESALNPFAVALLGGFSAVSSGAHTLPERFLGGPGRSCPQDGPKTAQDAPKMAQEGPKMAPGWPKMAPRRPQDRPRWSQEAPGWPQEPQREAPMRRWEWSDDRPTHGDPRGSAEIGPRDRSAGWIRGMDSGSPLELSGLGWFEMCVF